MESKKDDDVISVAKSQMSRVSKAPSKAPSVAQTHVSQTESMRKAEEEKHEALLVEIRKKY